MRDEPARLCKDLDTKLGQSRQLLVGAAALERVGTDTKLIGLLVGHAIFAILFLTWWARGLPPRRHH